MSHQGTIKVDPAAAAEHTSLISGHSSYLNATAMITMGGLTNLTIAVNELTRKTIQTMGRYVSALPRSARDITFIAERVRIVDAESGERFTLG